VKILLKVLGRATFFDSHCTLTKNCNLISSDSMVQPQLNWDWFGNISNLELELVEPNRIGDSIYACIRLLFANLLTMMRACTYRSMT